MSKFFIYLKVPEYLKQYLENSLGDPVLLPDGSPERIIVERFIQKKSDTDIPDTENDSNLRVQIPPMRGKPPEYWNYFSEEAKNCLIESFEAMFTMNMWKDLNNINNILANSTLTNLIYAWLRKNGMSIDHWEMVRQRYYRYRKRYKKKGISL